VLALALLLTGIATAGDLYVNGVLANGLRDQEFKDADIRIDAEGDVHIDAPQYVVRSLDPVPVTPPNTGPSPSAVPRGVWWLVTEDQRSSGHSIELFINGALVRRISSGEPQLILDLAPWLASGLNDITFSALPGPQPSGGVLHVYLGTGQNDAGVIRMHDPEIDYARRSSDPPSGGMQDFTISVR